MLSTAVLEQRLGLNADDVRRLRVFEEMVARWSKVKNLVSASALSDLWRRHILDSVQVQRTLPEARTWVDLGSGGGFPGIVTAILLAEYENASVTLVESDGRKCAFLRAVSRETGLRTQIVHDRIENAAPNLGSVDAVSARALARLDKLVGWADPLLEKGAVGVFPKGKDVQSELTEIQLKSRFRIELQPSIIDADGALVLIRRQ